LLATEALPDKDACMLFKCLLTNQRFFLNGFKDDEANKEAAIEEHIRLAIRPFSFIPDRLPLDIEVSGDY